jgi:hypothetical protein
MKPSVLGIHGPWEWTIDSNSGLMAHRDCHTATKAQTWSSLASNVVFLVSALRLFLLSSLSIAVAIGRLALPLSSKRAAHLRHRFQQLSHVRCRHSLVLSQPRLTPHATQDQVGHQSSSSLAGFSVILTGEVLAVLGSFLLCCVKPNQSTRISRHSTIGFALSNIKGADRTRQTLVLTRNFIAGPTITCPTSSVLVFIER